jgi:MFS family permease
VPIFASSATCSAANPSCDGVALFVLGSIPAARWSMPALIAFRAVQGLGAGASSPPR